MWWLQRFIDALVALLLRLGKSEGVAESDHTRREADVDSGYMEDEGSPDGVPPGGAFGATISPNHSRLRGDGEPVTRWVYFGTEREIIARNPVTFGSVAGNRLTLGRTEVTIPPNHRRGRMESPPQFPLVRAVYDPMRHIVVSYSHVLTTADFLSSVEAEFDAEKSAFVFVHGFATSFENAARRAAQLHYDLRFPGPPLMFSWASAGQFGPVLYNKDAEASLNSAALFREFLDDVVLRSGVETLHVIAHSMGNRALIEALRDWRPSGPTSIKQIVLIAPDVNKRYFQRLAADIRTKGHRTTLYGSAWDLALWASRNWAGGEERAGDCSPPVVVEGVQTIDVSAMHIPNDLLNHFVLDDDLVLSDLKELLDSDLPMDRRLRLEAVGESGARYWRMRKQ